MNAGHQDEGMRCPYCNATSRALFSVGDINQRMSSEIFHYYRCGACGLIFLANIPEDLQTYYGHAYSAYQKADGGSDGFSDYDRGKIEVVKQYARGNKLLEIGPASGNFALLAKKEGFIVDAIEMDAECSRRLAEDIQIRHVVNSSDIVGALAGIEERYDVIVMWHVLEHLGRPWEVLDAFPGMLAPNGVVVIAVPNPESLQFRLLKQYWKHVDAPRHTMFLPSQLLTRVMERAGARKVLVTTRDKVSSVFNTYGWWANSLSNYFGEHPNRLLARLLKNRYLRFLIYTVFVRWVEGRDGLGNAYLAVYRKA